MKVTIEVPEELVKLADRCKSTPEAILQSFVANLTATPGNGGSDERRMALDYFRRTYIGSQLYNL